MKATQNALTRCQTHNVPSLPLLTLMLSVHSAVAPSLSHTRARTRTYAHTGRTAGSALPALAQKKTTDVKGSLQGPAGALPTWTRVRDMTGRTQAAFGGSSMAWPA